MNNAYMHCPIGHANLVYSFVNGESELDFDTVESIICNAFENDEMSLSAYQWLIDKLYE